jgi:hypothetical protein
MATPIVPNPQAHVLRIDASIRELVVREPSILADALRASGWVARAGWRRHSSNGGVEDWFVRFELPETEQ